MSLNSGKKAIFGVYLPDLSERKLADENGVPNFIDAVQNELLWKLECGWLKVKLNEDLFTQPITEKTEKFMKKINDGKSINLRELTPDELVSLWKAFFGLLTTSLLPSRDTGYRNLFKYSESGKISNAFKSIPKEHVETFRSTLKFLESYIKKMKEKEDVTITSKCLAKIITPYFVFPGFGNEAEYPKEFVEDAINNWRSIPDAEALALDDTLPVFNAIKRQFNLKDGCYERKPESHVTPTP